MKYVNHSGNVFVFGGYRMRVSIKGRAALSKILSEEKRSHGEFVLLTDRKGSEGIAVFAKDSGYSAGEFLRTRMNETFEGDFKNIIYVEAADDDSETLLVVVINNGKIELDTIISEQSDLSELELALEALETSDLYLSGVLTNQVQHIFFSEKIARTVEDCPSFFAEKFSGTYGQLLSIEDCLNAAGFKKSTNGTMLILILAVIAGCAGYYIYQEKEAQKRKQVKMVVDPFSAYKAETKVLPSPVSTVFQSIELLHDVTKLDGWGFTTITVNRDNSFSIVLSSLGGNFSSINTTLGKYNQFATQLKGVEVIVNGNLNILQRQFPYVLYSLPKVENKLFESFVVDAGYKLSTVNDIDKGFYMTRQYELNLQNASLVDFNKVSSTLTDMPVVINSIVIKPGENGFDLIVSLLIFGSRG